MISILLLILVIEKIMINYIFGQNSIVVWTSLSAIATFLLCAIAFFQLKQVNKTEIAKFNLDFQNGFFTTETRNLLILFDANALTFVNKKIDGNNEDVYFQLDRDNIKKYKSIKSIKPGDIKSIYSAYEIDDLLLGNFEEISLFYEQGLLDMKSIYAGFDWYIETVYKNKEIQKYIDWQRK